MKSYLLKLVLCGPFISLLIIVYAFYRDVNYTKLIATGKMALNAGIQKSVEEKSMAKENVSKVNGLKYILQWTSDLNVPFVDMGKGQKGFIDRKCPHTNCFVTSNQSYLGDLTKFDVIAFAGPELSEDILYRIGIPKIRSPHQKYVFGSIESPNYYPIITDKYDGFFNWTWTYKLDSEVHWGYIVIRDLHDNIIGPRKDMNWLKPDKMTPVSHQYKQMLKTKRKAAVSFISNCVTESSREEILRELREELGRYRCMGTNCTIDVYGKCGSLVCSHDHQEICDKKIAMTYYFYLSFENALSEDYVTEKLLRALNNDAVPIVYGGANYTR